MDRGSKLPPPTFPARSTLPGFVRSALSSTPPGQWRLRSSRRISRRPRRPATRHDRGPAPQPGAMNVTRVLSVALPEIPARTLSQRPPRFPPDVVWKEHIEDGQPVVRALVRAHEYMYRFPPANWTLAQLFNGSRSYEEIAQLFSAQTNTQCSPDDVREFSAALDAIDFWYRTPQEKNVLLMQKDAQKRRK